MEEKIKVIPTNVKTYAKIILAAPNAKKVDISFHTSKEAAEIKLLRMKSWPYKVITRARNENGRFTKGFALICCK